VAERQTLSSAVVLSAIVELAGEAPRTVDIGNGCAEMSIGYRVTCHTGAAINTEGDIIMHYCLLMHYQEGGEIGLEGSDRIVIRRGAAFGTGAGRTAAR
jgi:hypothetical protein